MSIFSTVPGLKPRKRKFNLSHSELIPCDMGQVVPCYVQEVVPGSYLKLNAAVIHRFMALLSPIYHNVNLYVHFWFMPNRLLDSKFARFIAGEFDRQVDADHPISGFYNPPYIRYCDLSDGKKSADAYAFSGSLLDFLGYPIPNWADNTVNPGNMTDHISVRRIQMYFTLVKLWYLNENIQAGFEDLLDAIDTIIDPDLSGNVSNYIVSLLEQMRAFNLNMCWPHAWQKNYFTSALPYVQLGAPVTLPLAGTAAVTIPNQMAQLAAPNDGVMTASFGSEGTVEFNTLGVQNEGATTGPIVNSENDDLMNIRGELQGVGGSLTATADLSDATAITINELRLANALQVLKERMARFGTRVREYYLGFFNVILSDKSLQQPQWLGGGKVPVNISEVEQTSATANSAVEGATTPQGNLAGKGFGGSGDFAGFKLSCEEEGIVLGLMFIQPKQMFGNQGLDRMLTKLNDRFDFFNPSLEHLGEQAIKASELYYAGDGHDNDTFGYTPRFAEYKFAPDRVHGMFMNTLNFWHLGRIFSERPTLSPEFIYTQNEEVRRIFAVQSISPSPGTTVDISSCLVWLYFTVLYKAPMSKFGTPMLLN